MKRFAFCEFVFLWSLALPSCNTYIGDVLSYEASPFGVPAPQPAVNATGYNQWNGRVVSIREMYGGAAASANILGIVELRPISGNYHFYNHFNGIVPLVDERGDFVVYGADYKAGSRSEEILGKLLKKSVEINGKNYEYVFVTSKFKGMHSSSLKNRRLP